MLILPGKEIQFHATERFTRNHNFEHLRNALTHQDLLFGQEHTVVASIYHKIIGLPIFGTGDVEFFSFDQGALLVVLSQMSLLNETILGYQGERWVRFHFCLEGATGVRIDDVEHSCDSGVQAHIMAQPENVDQTDKYYSGVLSKWISVFMKPKWFLDQTALNLNLVPRPFAEFLEGADTFYLEPACNVSMQLQQVLQQVFLPTPNPLFRPLYVKSKVLEALSIYLNDLWMLSHESSFSLSLKDREMLVEAKNLLEADPLVHHNMVSLARALGTNRNKLSFGFKELFGVTLHDYATTLKMQRALLMLGDGHNLSQIAFELGYNHISNLSAAIKKYFNASPRTLRSEIGKKYPYLQESISAPEVPNLSSAHNVKA